MQLTSIGHIKSSYTKSLIPYDHSYFEELKSKIIVDKEYLRGLKGLNTGDFIDVLYYLDRARPYELDGIHKRGIKDNPGTGLFNTRSPRRINPIAVSRVQIIDITGNVLLVKGLDAFDGSPLLDIKIAPRTS